MKPLTNSLYSFVDGPHIYRRAPVLASDRSRRQNQGRTRNKKIVVLHEIFAKELCELSLAFINIIVEKRREAILGSIVMSFIDLYNESKNIVNASVITAIAITDDIKTQVLAQLKLVAGNSEVLLEELVDETIIGGFVLHIGGREFNASIANKLQKLKREFVSNPYIKEY